MNYRDQKILMKRHNLFDVLFKSRIKLPSIKMKQITLLMIFGILIQNSYGQKKCGYELKTIESKSEVELLKLDKKYIGNLDSICIPKFLNKLLKHANLISSKDLKTLTYRQMSLFLDYPENITYSDSVIKLTKQNLKHELFAKQHYVKGVSFYNNDKPIESMKAFMNGYKRAKEANHIIMIIDYLNAMGSVKGSYSKDKDAILLNHKAYYLIENNKEVFGNDYLEQLLLTIDNMAIHHIEYKDLDSAMYYIKKARPLIQKSVNEEYWKINFNSLEGQTHYYMGNYFKAKKILYPILEESTDYEKGERLFYIGMAEGHLGNFKTKDSIFLKIVEIFKKIDGYPSNLGNVYRHLLEKAIESRDKESQRYYMSKKSVFDSVVEFNEYNLMYLNSDDFNIAKLLDTKEELQKKLKLKTEVIWLFVFIAILILIILSYFYVRYIRVKKSLKKIINQGLTPKVAKESVDNIINKSLEEVLDNLNEWEASKGFLKRSITQQSLAKELKTNDTYLSQVVNIYKNQRFPDYIKDLRITYMINDLRSEPLKAEKKSQIQLAERYGFNSVDVFRRAMIDKIQVSPAKFLKEIKNSNL